MCAVNPVQMHMSAAALILACVCEATAALCIARPHSSAARACLDAMDCVGLVHRLALLLTLLNPGHMCAVYL